MKAMKLSDLTVDESIYPREQVDWEHVESIRHAIRLNVVLPPIVVSKGGNTIVDGVHRYEAYLAEFGDNYSIECIEKNYKSVAELFLDSVRFNATHGKNMTKADRLHCSALAARLHIDTDAIGKALNVSASYFGSLRSSGTSGVLTVDPVIKKLPNKHMAQSERKESDTLVEPYHQPGGVQLQLGIDVLVQAVRVVQQARGEDFKNQRFFDAACALFDKLRERLEESR